MFTEVDVILRKCMKHMCTNEVLSKLQDFMKLFYIEFINHLSATKLSIM